MPETSVDLDVLIVGAELSGIAAACFLAQNHPAKRVAIFEGHHLLPMQSARDPGKLQQNYVREIAALRFGKIDDGTLPFTAAQR
ncbi:MAG: NAD(P)-binding protein [Candidatus Velthaea sp.]